MSEEREPESASKREPSEHRTLSGIPVKRVYRPEDIEDLDYDKDLGDPGSPPFTRGVYPTMYRSRYWTMRQFSGFGTSEETNQRFRYLLDQGQTGLSVAFDFPTLLGHDSDEDWSDGEVGKLGVAVDTLDDMERLFDGIPLDQVSTSMTINGPAPIILAMYFALTQKRGISGENVRGTVQADILKEYMAQKTYIYPPEPSMRMITDIFEYCTEHYPNWNTISISGYHIREAGATAVQELAFTLANGFTYIEAGMEAGLDVDEFAPRLSFFFNAHNDFFEEIAKYRAARRIWARRLKDVYGARDPKSLRMKFHTQTAGCSLTAQQPENNIVRTTIQALAGVLGGTQSLHTNSMDEAMALPTEKAVRIALRTQQIIAEESGVSRTVDPLGGSYFVEALTNEMEERAEAYFKQIERLGGVIPAIEVGFFQKEIADASYDYQQRVESGETTVVGVNQYTEGNEDENMDILRVDRETQRRQIKRLEQVKNGRDPTAVEAGLKAVESAARSGDNIMPPLVQAVKAYATLGEIVEVLKDVFGEYREEAMF